MLAQGHLDELRERIPSLDGLTTGLAERLRQEATHVALPEGTSVFREGQTCEAFVAITAGSVRVSKLSEEGRELLLYHVVPGQICVLTVHCLLGGSPYPARGTAVGDLAGVAIPGELFETLIGSVTPFRRDVFGLLSHRLAIVLGLVEEVAFHRLDRRLAALLIRRSAARPDEPLRLTHQDLADDLGSSREIVSRILESLESQGMVELGRKRIALRDRQRISELAGPFCD